MNHRLLRSSLHYCGCDKNTIFSSDADGMGRIFVGRLIGSAHSTQTINTKLTLRVVRNLDTDRSDWMSDVVIKSSLLGPHDTLRVVELV